MHGAVPTLSGTLTTLLAMLLMLALAAVTVAFPFLVISVVRNISRTRKALERIADSLDSRRGASGGGVLGL